MKELLKELTILYVEDFEDIREVAVRALNKKLKKTYAAIDGNEGYALYLKHKEEIDLIISDISMPNSNGLEMIKRIREEDGNQTTPIILTTAYTETEYLMESIELGVTNYLLKPINFNLLLEKIHHAIINKQKLKKFYQISQNMKNQAFKDAKEFINEYEESITEQESFLLDDNFTYDFSSKIIIDHNQNRRISLNNQEISLIELLIKNRNNTVTYDSLIEVLSTNEVISLNSLRSIVKRVRNKTSKNVIKVTSKVGYYI